MNAPTNALQVTLRNPDGSGDLTTTVDQFVNASRVVSDIINKPPAGFIRVLQIIQVDLRNMTQGGDTYPVGGGKVGISGRAYAAMRQKAGIHIVESRVKDIELEGREGLQVTVWAIRPRPGLPSAPECRSATLTYESYFSGRSATTDAEKQKCRGFLPRHLETVASNRVTRAMLGEPGNYAKQDLEANEGRFLLVSEVPDPSDPTTRELMIKQAVGATQDLYGRGAALPEPTNVEPVESHELLGSGNNEGGVEGAGDPTQGPPVGDSVPSAPAEPAWVLGFEVDSLTGRDFGSLPVDALEVVIRGELKRIGYDYTKDAAHIKELGIAGEWVRLAQTFYAWQTKRGVG